MVGLLWITVRPRLVWRPPRNCRKGNSRGQPHQFLDPPPEAAHPLLPDGFDRVEATRPLIPAGEDTVRLWENAEADRNVRV